MENIYAYPTNYGKEEVDEMLTLLLHKKIKYSLLRDVLIILILSILIGLGFYYSDFVMIVVRMFLVYVIHPFVFDIKTYSGHGCIIYNPRYNENIDCNIDHQIVVETVNYGNLSQLRYERIVLTEQKWLVIRGTDAPLNWQIAQHSSSIKSISLLYQNDPHLLRGIACELETSLTVKKTTPYSRLLYYIDNSRKFDKDWFVSWKHCGKNQIYSFRKLYKTPKFLPIYAHITDAPWIVIIKQFEDFVPLPSSSTHIIVLTVIEGSIRIFLTPIICGEERPNNKADDQSIILKKGDMFTGSNYAGATVEMVAKQRYSHGQHNSTENGNNLAVIVILFPETKYN